MDTNESAKLAALRDAYYREYDTLRQESMQTMGNRSQIISFGLGSIGILIGASVAIETKTPEFIGIMFNYIVPFVAFLIYLAWFGEFERMVRAGKYLQSLENLINDTLPRAALSWEHDSEWMRMGYAYIAIAMVFLGIASTSPLIGFALLASSTGTFKIRILIFPLSFSGFLQSPILAWFLTAVAIIFSSRRKRRRFPKFSKDI